LNAVQYTLATQFPEQIWCYFVDSKGCRFYVGVCYRTPSVNVYSTGNHDLLREVIGEMGSTNKHFVFMGDFNYRFLQWPPLSDDISIKSEAIDFCHCLEDNFLAQHVDFCTRNDAILDLVISDESNFERNDGLGSPSGK